MSNSVVRLVIGTIWEEEDGLNLGQFCRCCGVSAEFVVEMINEGILEPGGRDPRNWRFQPACVDTVRTVLHLRRDLGINLPGAALAINLLERIDHLQAKLRARDG